MRARGRVVVAQVWFFLSWAGLIWWSGHVPRDSPWPALVWVGSWLLIAWWTLRQGGG